MSAGTHHASECVAKISPHIYHRFHKNKRVPECWSSNSYGFASVLFESVSENGGDELSAHYATYTENAPDRC